MIRLVRNLDLFKKAEQARKESKSYSQIKKQLGISKSTLSSWFSKKNWSKSVRTQLIDKYNYNPKHIAHMHDMKTKIKLERHQKFIQEAKTEYESKKNNHLFIAGICLYWGEGEKTNSGRVSVINTDTEMLQVVLNFFRTVLKIPESKLRAGLFIYQDINPNQALEYWAEKTKISKAQFIKTQVIPSRSKLTKRRSVNGICSVYFSSKEMSIKIMEWIKLLSQNMRV